MSSVKWGVFRSSILRKQFVAITGLLMTGFIFTHLAGNLLIFLGHGRELRAAFARQGPEPAPAVADSGEVAS